MLFAEDMGASNTMFGLVATLVGCLIWQNRYLMTENRKSIDRNTDATTALTQVMAGFRCEAGPPSSKTIRQQLEEARRNNANPTNNH